MEQIVTDFTAHLWSFLPSDAQEVFKSCEAGEVETLKLLLNNSSNSSQLLLQVDGRGYTALHYASNRDTAKVLVEFVEPNKLREFLWVTDKSYKRTALVRAVWYNRADVVEYLCGLTSADESLLDGHLLPGDTPLHDAGYVRIARILVESVPTDKLTDLLLHTDGIQQTALHAAARWGRGEIVEYLCGLSTTQLSSADELLYMKDEEGRTALHLASTAEIARLLVDTAQDKLSYISTTDNEGNTAVMSMTVFGCTDALDYILQHISIEFGISAMKSALLKTNIKKRNIFHIACISPLIEHLYELLEEYLYRLKVEDLFTADIFNNTPFTYLVARYSTRLFAQFILKFPLWQRRILLLSKNQMDISCLDVSVRERFQSDFYIQQVLCQENGAYYQLFNDVYICDKFSWDQLFTPEKYTRYNLDLFRVMKYALNEYSLLDEQMISTQSEIPALTSSVQGCKQQQTVEMDENSVTAQSTLLFYYFDADELALEDIQRELYKLDGMGKHNGPKVIVVRCSTSDLVRYVSPPGPDFIIITLVSVHSVSDMFSDLQTKSFRDIEQLLGYLKRQEIVKYININSTMARHYGSSSTEPADDHMLLSGASKGKALIICSTSEREQWEVEHGYACRVMEQLSLQVECLYDKSADDMLTAISEFSRSSGHGSLTALCIMSHGDLRGNICGDGGKGLCSVQQVVDALCQPDIQSVTKMIFLTFCRGPINHRNNRTNASWECTTLEDTALLMEFSPIRYGLPRTQLDVVRQNHPFPSVDIPENCYICYSTLPDTKSLRFDPSISEPNQMFVSLSYHLNNIYRCSTRYKREVIIPAADSSTDCVVEDEVAGTSAPEMDIYTTEQDVDVSTQQQLPRVELIPLLVDVTAIVREKSRFTQYMNYCYVVTKEYKPVVLEILPINVLND